MPSKSPLAILAMIAAMSPVSIAQQPDGSPINLPQLVVSKCVYGGGCTSQTNSVVLDWGSHWIHTRNYQDCKLDGFPDKNLCPDAATCSQNCVITPANYANQGIYTNAETLTLYQFRQDPSMASVSPRVYLLGPDGNYDTPSLLNKEYSFIVDLSNTPCGQNAAMYLTQMDKTGYRSATNQGASQFGAGYCDGAGFTQGWNKGLPNNSKARSWCQEMDLLEGNYNVTTMAPHPCIGESCQQYGCGWNPYSQGNRNFWPGAVNTKKPITVITQFITNDGTSTGTLSKIVRKYVQDGFMIASSTSGGDVITDAWCNTHGGSASTGGLAALGQGLASGMAQIFSLWNAGDAMDWLDAGSNGPCKAGLYTPAYLQANYPGARVVYSGIRYGDIGSTYAAQVRPPPAGAGQNCGWPDFPPDCISGYTCTGSPKKCQKL